MFCMPNFAVCGRSSLLPFVRAVVGGSGCQDAKWRPQPPIPLHCNRFRMHQRPSTALACPVVKRSLIICYRATTRWTLMMQIHVVQCCGMPSQPRPQRPNAPQPQRRPRAPRWPPPPPLFLLRQQQDHGGKDPRRLKWLKWTQRQRNIFHWPRVSSCANQFIFHCDKQCPAQPCQCVFKP